MISRRVFTTLPVAALPAAPAQVHLVAHRGGVVDKDRPENSPSAIRAALEQDYWMIEVDVRRTRDGEPVLQHDPTFQRYYGETRRPEEMTWLEISKLRSTPGAAAPLHFEEACRMCRSRLRLMLDMKGSWEPAFYQRLLRIIEGAGIPKPVYSLGGPRVKPLFGGEVMVSVNRQTLREAADRGDNVARDYFLFELGSDLRQESFDLCRKLNVTPVAAINTFRYTMAKRDEWEGPKEDIAALRKLGVAHYQVDSRYAPLLRS
jgi:hypothetical protein